MSRLELESFLLCACGPAQSAMVHKQLELFKKYCQTLVRGSYQKKLIAGGAAWSGSDLSGKAKQYNLSYYKSRQKVLAILNSTFNPALRFSIEKDSADYNRHRLCMTNAHNVRYWL